MADKSNVLVRLQLLGRAAFSRETKAATGDLKGFGRSGRDAGTSVARGSTRATSALGRVQGATRKAAKEMKGLRGSVVAATAPFANLATVAAAAGGIGLVGAAAAAVTFEQSMANVQARLDLTNKAMRPLNGLALQLGARTQFSAKQAADAMGELAASGLEARQIFKVLPGTLALAAASGVDLADAAALQTATLNGFKLSAGKANYVADVLAKTVNKSAINMSDLSDTMKYIAPVAHSTGQSFADMMASVALMGNVGIKGEQAGTTLRGGLVRLIKPSKQVRDVLADLGLKGRDFAGPHGLKPLPRILALLAGRMSGLSEYQKKQALATIFGTNSLSGMLALVDKGPRQIDKLSRAIDRSRGYAKHAASIMRNTVSGAWDNFTGSVETAAIALTRKYMPAVRRALNAGAGGVNQFTTGLTTGATTRKVKLQGVGAVDVPASGAQRAGGTVRNLAGQALKGVAAVGRVVIPAIRDAVKQLLDALKPAMPFVKNVLLPLLEGIGQGILVSVVAAFKVAVPIIKLVATVLGAIGKAAAPLRPVIKGIGVVIGFLLAGPILKVLGTIPKVGIIFRALAIPIRVANVALRTIARVVGAGIRLWLRAHLAVLRFVGTFTGLGARLARPVLNAMGTVISTIERFGGKLLTAGKGIGGKLLSGIKHAFTAAGGAAAGLGGALMKWINDHTPFGDKVKVGPLKFRLPALPTFAAGGVMGSSGLALVGERGPELVGLRGGDRVYNNRQTSAALSGSRRMPTMAAPSFGSTTVVFRPTLDGKVIHESVFRVERGKVEQR